MTKKPAPGGLGDRALALWEGITGVYDLRMDELFVLEDACREVDLIDRMEAEQAVGELVARGSQGQPVAAPMIAELRQHRAMFAGLMKQLKLPDEDGRAQQATSDAARKAANARWGRSG